MNSQFAALAASFPSSTLHKRARKWCNEFADDWRQLAAGGLEQPETDANPPTDVDIVDLAKSVDVDRRNLEWNGDVWVLADPSLLNQDTNDMFRRTLRVVTDRLTEGDTHYPYDHLEDGGQRAEWIERCLESGEIVDPRSVRGGGQKGVTDDQRSLDSF